MKYAVILGDGMADLPDKNLGGKTCLEAAKTPTFDALAPLSEIGLCRTVPAGYTPGSDVANMAVMGFDPKIFYTGRSPLEAISMGVKLGADDFALRCNLVTLSGGELEDAVMLDYSAGEITTEEASELIAAIAPIFKKRGHDLYAGISYRHCLVMHGAGAGCALKPPHDITDRPVREFLPKNGELLEIMRECNKILSAYPVNKERIARGKNPANSVWLWGEGKKPKFENFEKLHGVSGAVISAVDLVRGIGMAAGMKIIPVEGATGNYETNFSGKADAAADALLAGEDFIYIHMEAPDECGHHGDVEHKIYSIEQVDKVTARLMERLDGEEFALLIMPDHPTPCALKTHTSDPVPYMIYTNTQRLEGGAARYTERYAASTGNYVGEAYHLIEKLLSL